MGRGDGPVVEEGKTRIEFPDALPVLPIRDLVVFPYMMAPLMVARDISAAAVEAALETREKLVLLCAQKDGSTDDPDPAQLHELGCIGMIVRMRTLSDGRMKVLVQGLVKARVTEWIEPIAPEKAETATAAALRARYERLNDLPIEGAEERVEAAALVRSTQANLERYAQSGKIVAPELMLAVGSVEEPGRLADLVAAHLALKVHDAQPLLEQLAPLERLRSLNLLVSRELDIQRVRAKIETRAKEELSKTQREYFLREQLRAIRTELGDTGGKGEEIDELRAQIARAGLPEEAEREAAKQLKRLETLSSEAAEAGVVRTFLDWLVEIPWREGTPDKLDLVEAHRVLDEDHYDLKDVKARILEYLGVRKLKGDGSRGPILCLVGPPGVGKTSLGRSIARALGRRFVRVSLGGVRDEAEIRGHRRTYVGAMPGRILQGMKQAGMVNPVFLLDEIDKLGTAASGRGDPAGALLEVLDPEQNHTFRDHYLGLAYDLSRVLFLATANHDADIPPALRDRMEILRLPGYSSVEKQVIARRFVLPRQLDAAGLTAEDLVFSPAALRGIIGEYTREAGLRDMERHVARICRKHARRVAEKGRETVGKTRVTKKRLPRWLGLPPYPEDEADKREDAIGVVTGLAWTPYGGELLTVEAQAMPGAGTLTLTGQLGDVMKESAQAALSFARAYATAATTDTNPAAAAARPFKFKEHEIHIHVPAGAVPKDGPSAGVTMAVALVSLLSGRPVRHDVAMTGEITLRGRILPVGGLREKLLAAARSREIARVIVPAGNAREISELPRHLKERLAILPVRTLAEALAAALADPAGTRSATRSPAPPAPPASRPTKKLKRARG